MNQKKVGLFGSVRVLCNAAILTAVAVVIAYVCKFFTIGTSIRITFENLPIILAGYVYGPWVGLAVGGCADFINTAVSQYGLGGLNPILTLGAASVGLMSGIFSRVIPKGKPDLRLVLSVASAHIVGNMLIKSAGLMIWYGTPIISVLPRIPLYTLIGAVEFVLLRVITRSSAMKKAMGETL